MNNEKKRILIYVAILVVIAATIMIYANEQYKTGVEQDQSNLRLEGDYTGNVTNLYLFEIEEGVLKNIGVVETSGDRWGIDLHLEQNTLVCLASSDEIISIGQTVERDDIWIVSINYLDIKNGTTTSIDSVIIPGNINSIKIYDLEINGYYSGDKYLYLFRVDERGIVNMGEISRSENEWNVKFQLVTDQDVFTGILGASEKIIAKDEILAVEDIEVISMTVIDLANKNHAILNRGR